MRNAILAAGVIAAGISANMGLLSTSPSNVDQHSEVAQTALSMRLGHPKYPRDHPLAVLYDFDDPNNSFHTGQNCKPDKRRNVDGTVELNLTNPDEKVEATVNSSVEAEEEPACLDPLDHDIDFLIATIPDPAKTHLALMFDRHLEAIMLAAQDSGYSFDRYWLPWRIESEPDSSDLDVRKKSDRDREARERLPGLLLFRGSDGKPPLAIFVVGETPTSGLDRHQFFRAASYIQNLHQKQNPHQKFLGILGPMFSGSISSLTEALKDSKIESARVVSGTVTGYEIVPDSQKDLPGFSSTVLDDSHADRLVKQHLNHKTALLAEDGTGYGSGTSPFDRIYYPREISRLRNAYQNDPVLSGAKTNPDPQATRNQLLFPLNDSQIGRDTTPQFSAGQTPITQETELFHIAETLKRGRYQVVIVTATNILDSLFLSRFLRDACPDLRVVAFDSDLLFVHGTDSADYAGTLSVSTYPLNPEILPPLLRSPHFFASNEAEGAYYAGMGLLQSREDYSMPPLWLSVVGRGSYWPIAISEDESPPSAPTPTRIWNAVFVLCSALALAYCGMYFYVLRGPGPLDRWCSDFHPSPPDRKSASFRPHYHLLNTLFLLAAYCALSFEAVHLAFISARPDWWLRTSIAAACVAALLYVALDTSRRFWHAGFALFIAAVSGAASMAFQATSHDVTAFFRAIRSVDLTSGVAPNLPVVLLLLAVLWWAWANMQRFIFVVERDPEISPLNTLPSAAISQITGTLDGLPFAGGQSTRYVFAFLFASIFLLSYWSHWFALLESKFYYGLILFLIALVGSLLLTGGYGYLQVWGRLRRLLEALDSHPMREAFSGLPSVSSWATLWQPSARKRNYTVLQRLAGTLRRLRNLKPGYYPGLGTDVENIEEKVASVLKLVELGQREPAAMISGVNERAGAIAGKLEAELMKGAWQEGASDTLGKLKKELDDAKVPDILAAEAIALRYFTFIRYVMLHMQNQLSFLTGGFILAAIALNCYPFQGGSYVRWCVTGIFVVLAVIVIDVLMEMERDATLSRLTDTKAGEITRGFYVRLLSAGALPLLAAVGSHFPSVGRFLFSWVQPALSALH